MGSTNPGTIQLIGLNRRPVSEIMSMPQNAPQVPLDGKASMERTPRLAHSN